MARNIRWFVSFKSQNGTSCRVNIYDNDWPEGVTMGLRGAADPFSYEEDNSDDLLNDVIRYRTGYIRVVENYFGQLDDIYPASTFNRYVEFLYGGSVVFNGYIQVQDFAHTLDFSTAQNPCPNVIELPVISPMGLFHLRKFTRIVPPTTKTLGQLLDVALNNSTYQKVVVPDITGVGLWMTVYSLFVSPWNEDYHHSMTVAALNKTMAPESYEYLIDAICKAFGWICHDTPQALVFTMFDHQGGYCNYPVGHIGDTNYKQTESIGTNPIDVTDYFTLADDSATINTILPDTGIEVEYEGHMGNVEFSFERTTFYGVEMVHDDDPREIVSICNLHPVGGLYENTASLYHAFDSSGFVTGVGAGTVAWNGKEGILVTGFGAAPTGWELFKLRLYVKHLLELSWVFDFGYMTSANGAIAALTEDSENKFTHLNVTFAENDNYVELTFNYIFSTYDNTPLSDHFLMFIHDIKFTAVDVNGEPYAEYKYAPAKSSDLLPSSIDNPPVSSSVTMPISLYRLNDRMIGDTLRTTKLTEYPYLMQKRKELNGKFRWAQNIDLPHARMWSFMSKKWRLIAQTFRPWDDEFELTMQHSGTLDVSSYSITTNLENVTSNAPAKVNEGDTLVVTLTGATGYQVIPWKVVVTMGNMDVTESAYNNQTNVITIPSVTDNVTITAYGVHMGAAYKPVEYIKSNGTISGKQFILGYAPTNLTEVKADVNVLELTDYSSIFGTRTNSAPYFAIMAKYSSTNYGRGWWGNKVLESSAFGACVKAATRQTITMGKGSLTYMPDGSDEYVTLTFTSTQATPWTASYGIQLGGFRTNSSTFRGIQIQIYEFQIKEDNAIVRDYVPCYRIADNVVGLYDTVNDSFLMQSDGGSDWTIPT